MAGADGETDGTGNGVEQLVRSYYRALEAGSPLADFYATDDEAGTLGPVVKFGSGKGEAFTGFVAIAAEVSRVRSNFSRNRLESRALLTHVQGNIGWFSDQVWWRGEDDGKPFASLTRWSGVSLLTAGGWRFLLVHVSEEV